MVDIPKSLFNASELMTISTGFRNAVNGIPQDTTIQKLVSLILNDEVDLNSAMSKGQSSKLTKTIEEFEGDCDYKYATFRNLTKIFAEQKDDPEIARTATVILTILRNVNWDLHLLGYKKQLVQLEVLDKKLCTDQVSQALEISGLKKWYDSLCASTAKLREIAGQRVEEVGDNDLPLTKESRLKLLNHLLKLHNHIDTQEELEPEMYSNASRAMDATLTMVIPEARARKANSKKSAPAQLDAAVTAQ